jgi:hypothetical protein
VLVGEKVILLVSWVGHRAKLERQQSMSQMTLFDFVESNEKKRYKERVDKDNTRRRVYKKLMSGGQWQILLRIARQIPQPFTLNDLSVACHQADQENFGMKGYPHYPDNHRIHWILYGRRGLIERGLILRVKQGLFQLPEPGALEALLQAAEQGESSADALAEG